MVFFRDICVISPTGVKPPRRHHCIFYCFVILKPPSQAGTLSKCSINPWYLSPGISSRLVIPVQLISRVWKERAGGLGQSTWEYGHIHLIVPRIQTSYQFPPPFPTAGHPHPIPSTFSLTGRRIKNIDTAPTIGRSPMSGSRITRKTPCSWDKKRRSKAFPQKRPSVSPQTLPTLVFETSHLPISEEI